MRTALVGLTLGKPDAGPDFLGRISTPTPLCPDPNGAFIQFVFSKDTSPDSANLIGGMILTPSADACAEACLAVPDYGCRAFGYRFDNAGGGKCALRSTVGPRSLRACTPLPGANGRISVDS